MEKYLEGETLSQDELEALLDKAIAQGIFIPVFVGSSTKLQGVEDLMDEIVSFFPQPTAHGPSPLPTETRFTLQPKAPLPSSSSRRSSIRTWVASTS